MRSLRRRAPLALAAVFAASGTVHLVRPRSFAAIMPRAIPREQHTALIYASGVAELVCTAGLVRRTRWAAFRRRGTGRALVRRLADIARGAGCYGMWVVTDEDNEAARATYEGSAAVPESGQVVEVWTF